MLHAPYFSFILLTALSGPALASMDYLMSPWQQSIIEHDLENFCRLDFEAKFYGKVAMEVMMMKALGIEEFNCAQLRDYLEQKIALVVTEFSSDHIVLYDRSRRLNIRESDRAGMFQQVVQDATEWMFDFEGIIAANFKSGLHSSFDRPRTRLALLFSRMALPRYDFFFEYTTTEGRRKLVPLADPLAGTIVLVKDLFFIGFNHPNPDPSNIYTLSNSVFRISSLLHEIFHDSSQYDHVICKSGFNRGKGMCDNEAFGPYGFESIFHWYASKTCNECTAMERQNLESLALIYAGDVNPPLIRRVISAWARGPL